MMSTSSLVMAAWRPRLYFICSIEIMSLAFFDALSMALRLHFWGQPTVRDETMPDRETDRALCSHACASTSAA